MTLFVTANIDMRLHQLTAWLKTARCAGVLGMNYIIDGIKENTSS
jgi:hypothetical protein